MHKRRYFHSYILGQAWNEPIVHNIDSCFFVARVLEYTFYNRYQALFNLELDLWLEHTQGAAIQQIEIEYSLIVRDIVSPGDIFSNMAVGGDRQKMETLQDLSEEPSVGPMPRRNSTTNIGQIRFAFGFRYISSLLYVFQYI